MNLLGQNVNAYRGLTFDGGICTAELLRLVAAIDGIDRICHHQPPHRVHRRHHRGLQGHPGSGQLPAPAGAERPDRILTMMKRPHTVLEYKSKIRRLRAARPDITISSDFIVGFPNETDEDFEATMKLIEEINFDMSFSFIYSPRPGTLPPTCPMTSTWR